MHGIQGFVFKVKCIYACPRTHTYMHARTPRTHAHLWLPSHKSPAPGTTEREERCRGEGKAPLAPSPTQPNPTQPCPAPGRPPRRLPPGSTAAGSGPLRGGCGRGEKEEEEVVKEEDDDEEEEEKSDALRGPLLSTSPGRGSAGWVSWRRPDGSAAGSECEGEAGRGEERREDAPRGGRQGAGRRSGGR